MNESNLMTEGVLLMLIGMGTVFIFLTILVFLTGLIHKFFGQSEKTDLKVDFNNANSAEEVAAISAAVYAYRNKNLKIKE